MAIKTVLLLVVFLVATVGALVEPMIGVVAYLVHYQVWPDVQWWGRPLAAWNLRYAFTIGICLLIGTVLQKHKLKFGQRAIVGQEVLLVLFVAAMAFSAAAGADYTTRFNNQVYQSSLIEKILKVAVFCLLTTHVVTTVRRIKVFMWTMVLGTMYLGWQAFHATDWYFYRNRLNNIGGPDFWESSFLGAHFAMVLPIVGVCFLRGGKKARMVCALAGGLAVNGLILTQTRAAYVAVAVGIMAAVFFAVRGARLRLVLYLIPGLLAGYALTDTSFWQRMSTIWVSTTPPAHTVPTIAESYDPATGIPRRTVSNEKGRRMRMLTAQNSANVRLRVWRIGVHMLLDHPLGVGVGNFRNVAAAYDQTLGKRDAHNTYFRCAGEIGLPGITILLLMIAGAFAHLRRATRLARGGPREAEIRWQCYAFRCSLIITLVSSMFMSQVYIEEFWWLMLLPVCLSRAAEVESAGAPATLPATAPPTLNRGHGFTWGPIHPDLRDVPGALR